MLQTGDVLLARKPRELHRTGIFAGEKHFERFGAI
jgi:hypothetical protein